MKSKFGTVKIPTRKLSLAEWKLNIFCHSCRKGKHIVTAKDLLKNKLTVFNAAIYCGEKMRPRGSWQGVNFRRIFQSGHLKRSIKSAKLYGKDWHWGAVVKGKLFGRKAIFALLKDSREISHDAGGPVRFMLFYDKGWLSVKWPSRIVFSEKSLHGHRHAR